MQSNDPRRSQAGTCGFHRRSSSDPEILQISDFHLLSKEEKNQVFHRDAVLRSKERGWGSSVLKRLKELHPSTAERFEVKSDPTESLAMRLWSPEGRTKVKGFPPSYVCLSYCWQGDHRASTLPRRALASGSDLALPISPLMFSALMAQRTTCDTGIWIDRLCIDQNDAAEKAVSISAMDTVFRCAERVVAVLDDIEMDLEQQAFIKSQLNTLGDGWWRCGRPGWDHMSAKPPYLEQFPALNRLLYTILGSRYFTRAWCSHEIQLGTSFVFCMPCQATGSGRAPQEVFYFTSDFLHYLMRLSTVVPNPGESAAKSVMWATLRERLLPALSIDAIRYLGLGDELPENSEDFRRIPVTYTSQLQEIFSLGAGGDPALEKVQRLSSVNLDKSTIFLNIVGYGLAMKRRSIITELQCIRDLYLVGLAGDEALTLCAMGKHLNFSPNKDELSWLKAPTYVDLGCGALRTMPVPPMQAEVTQQLHIDRSRHSRWIQFDVLGLGLPRPPDKLFQNIAAQLITKCSSLQMGVYPSMFEYMNNESHQAADTSVSRSERLMQLMIQGMTTWGPGPEYQYWCAEYMVSRWKERFIWTVACLLDCGLAWTLGTAERCGYPATDAIEQRLRSFFVNGAWDLKCLRSMSWSSTEAGRSSIDAIMGVANWAVQWGVARPHGWDTDYIPTIIEHGPGHAMVFTRARVLLRFVIPCPLLPDEYGRLYRVWLLHAKDDPSWDFLVRREAPPEWFLQAKAILFTDVKAEDIDFSVGPEDHELNWGLRAQVRVHAPSQSFNDEIARGETIHLDATTTETPMAGCEMANLSELAGMLNSMDVMDRAASSRSEHKGAGDMGKPRIADNKAIQEVSADHTNMKQQTLSSRMIPQDKNAVVETSILPSETLTQTKGAKSANKTEDLKSDEDDWMSRAWRKQRSKAKKV